MTSCIYVASGQIDTETLTIDEQPPAADRLRKLVAARTVVGAAAPSAGAVAEGVASLAEVDARARENMRAGLDLMAADLLFTETTRTRQALREQLRALRVAESSAVADAQIERSETGVDSARESSPCCLRGHWSDPRVARWQLPQTRSRRSSRNQITFR